MQKQKLKGKKFDFVAVRGKPKPKPKIKPKFLRRDPNESAPVHVDAADLPQPEQNGQVNVEAEFAHRLAGNEPKVRSKAVKKLTRWITARYKAYILAKTNISISASKPFNLDEILCLWKGLYYCFWMSDKSIVQEELAERISAMIHCFRSTESAILFIRGFLLTLGREWLGIDQFRMDKFMMFTRRFLRQCFVFVAKQDWESSICTKLIEAFSKDALHNDRKALISKSASLGFQLHFTDIFLEELAKVGGEELADKTIRTFIQLFIDELKIGSDDRLASHIQERIFNHLMRQSDVGIAYEEGGSEDEEEADKEEDLDDENMDQDKNPEDVDDESDAEEDENDEADDVMDTAEGDNAVLALSDQILDPRAGRVDITLPQLIVDYSKLSEDLFKAGNANSVAQPQRKRLYKLSSQFRVLHAGKYPLAAEISDNNLPVPIFVRKSLAKIKKLPNSTSATPSSSEKNKKTPGTKSPQKKVKNKRVSFSMTSNKCQSVDEYMNTLHASPDVPFVPSKKPKQGLLKNNADLSVVSTPSPLGDRRAVMINTIKNGQGQMQQVSFNLFR